MSELESNEEDSRLLSRFGLWLLIEKCTPNERTPNEIVGRLLSMLFQWYGFTATLTQGLFIAAKASGNFCSTDVYLMNVVLNVNIILMMIPKQ